jgi:alkylhydroperoxidase family enzyme
MKTRISRFTVHDDLSAPQASQPILKGALAGAGQLPNFLGVLAGSPAALRGYTRFRAELRHGALPVITLERISLAVAEHFGSEPGIDLHRRVARQAGLALDDIALAAEWDARDEADAVLLRYLKDLVVAHTTPPEHLHEEAREYGWTEEQLLEAIAFASLECFTAMVNVAGDVPLDGSIEHGRRLRAA